MKNQSFLIRMRDGFFYSHMLGFRIMVTNIESEAYHFRSRFAALEVCGLTADFRGASIVEAAPQDAPPQPLEAA